MYRVVETKRGHNLDKVIERGTPAENTGVPGEIAGFSHERLLRSPAAGTFTPLREIAGVGYVLHGLIRFGTEVCRGMKLGDIDSSGDASVCCSVSD